MLTAGDEGIGPTGAPPEPSVLGLKGGAELLSPSAELNCVLEGRFMGAAFELDAPKPLPPPPALAIQFWACAWTWLWF